jgi:hypothetical protein
MPWPINQAEKTACGGCNRHIFCGWLPVGKEILKRRSLFDALTAMGLAAPQAGGESRFLFE